MQLRASSGIAGLRVLSVVLAVGLAAFLFLRSSERPLGPVDGHDLPGIDTARVQVGDRAPDFRLVAFSGDVVTLSEFRGEKNVVLVFYRGHW